MFYTNSEKGMRLLHGEITELKSRSDRATSFQSLRPNFCAVAMFDGTTFQHYRCDAHYERNRREELDL